MKNYLIYRCANVKLKRYDSEPSADTHFSLMILGVHGNIISNQFLQNVQVFNNQHETVYSRSVIERNLPIA